MTDFILYKEKKQEEQKNKRNNILENLHSINTNLLEMDEQEESKISQEFIRISKHREMEKLISVSKELNEEAKLAKEKMRKRGINLLFE